MMSTLLSAESDFIAVAEVADRYVRGLHHADTALLAQITDPDLLLMAPGVRRNRTGWLTLVASRPVPAQTGAEFNYQLQSISLHGSQASVRIYCPLLGEHYLDLLTLHRTADGWIIVNKAYASYPAGWPI